MKIPFQDPLSEPSSPVMCEAPPRSLEESLIELHRLGEVALRTGWLSNKDKWKCCIEMNRKGVEIKIESVYHDMPSLAVEGLLMQLKGMGILP